MDFAQADVATVEGHRFQLGTSSRLCEADRIAIKGITFRAVSIKREVSSPDLIL